MWGQQRGVLGVSYVLCAVLFILSKELHTCGRWYICGAAAPTEPMVLSDAVSEEWAHVQPAVQPSAVTAGRRCEVHWRGSVAHCRLL